MSHPIAPRASLLMAAREKLEDNTQHKLSLRSSKSWASIEVDEHTPGTVSSYTQNILHSRLARVYIKGNQHLPFLVSSRSATLLLFSAEAVPPAALSAALSADEAEADEDEAEDDAEDTDEAAAAAPVATGDEDEAALFPPAATTAALSLARVRLTKAAVLAANNSRLTRLSEDVGVAEPIVRLRVRFSLRLTRG